MFFNFRRFAAVEYPTLICSTTQAINTLPALATYSFALLTFFCASAGNYFVEMCRVLIYIFLPVAFVLSIINCEHDSLNPVAVLSPMVGMWLNCIVDGKGFGVINMLLFLMTGVFKAFHDRLKSEGSLEAEIFDWEAERLGSYTGPGLSPPCASRWSGRETRNE